MLTPGVTFCEKRKNRNQKPHTHTCGAAPTHKLLSALAPAAVASGLERAAQTSDRAGSSKPGAMATSAAPTAAAVVAATCSEASFILGLARSNLRRIEKKKLKKRGADLG
jgi:hypothetical protein